jgi:hypothetical protein
VFKPIDTARKELCYKFSGALNPPGKTSAIDLVELSSRETPLEKDSVLDLVEYSIRHERHLP